MAKAVPNDPLTVKLSWAMWQTDWQMDIGNNSLQLMHSMQPKIQEQDK